MSDKRNTYIQLPHNILDEVQLRRVLDRIIELLDQAFSERGDAGFSKIDSDIGDISSYVTNLENSITARFNSLSSEYVLLNSSNIITHLKLKGQDFITRPEAENGLFVKLDSSNLTLDLKYQDYEEWVIGLEAIGLSPSDFLTLDQINEAGAGIEAQIEDMSLIYRKYADNRYVMLDSSNLKALLSYASNLAPTDDKNLVPKKYVDDEINTLKAYVDDEINTLKAYVDDEINTLKAYVDDMYSEQATPDLLDSTATTQDNTDKINELIQLLKDSKYTT